MDYTSGRHGWQVAFWAVIVVGASLVLYAFLRPFGWPGSAVAMFLSSLMMYAALRPRLTISFLQWVLIWGTVSVIATYADHALQR